MSSLSTLALNENLNNSGELTRANSDCEMIDLIETSRLNVKSRLVDDGDDNDDDDDDLRDGVRYGRLSNLSNRSRKISCRQCGSLAHDDGKCEVSFTNRFANIRISQFIFMKFCNFHYIVSTIEI